MTRDFFCGCIIASLTLVGWSGLQARAETDASPAATPTTAIGAIDVKADEIELDMRRAGTWILKLSGAANVDAGDLQASGDNVKLSFSAKSKAMLYLVGKIHVRTDAICATARRAKVNFASATLELQSGDGQQVAVRTLDGEKESRFEAASIRFNALKNSIEASNATTIQISPKPD
jgi:hypothetical protein